MKKFDDISVIIPVREGSSRVKNKVNLPIFENISLLEWKIDQLLKVQKTNRIIISSNSDNIKGIAKNMGVEYHERSDYLSIGHQASFSEVITGIVKDIQTNHFAWITVVVPLMSPDEYRIGFELYIDNIIKSNGYDSLVAVNKIKEYLWNDNGPINYRADKFHTISQNLPNIFRVTNGLYMSSKNTTLELNYFLGSNPLKYIVSRLAGIDIDEQEDYEFSKSLVTYYLKCNK